MSHALWVLLDWATDPASPVPTPTPEPTATALADPASLPPTSGGESWYEKPEWWALVVSIVALLGSGLNGLRSWRTDQDSKRRLLVLEKRERRMGAGQVSAWLAREQSEPAIHPKQYVAWSSYWAVSVKNAGTSPIYRVVVAVRDGATGQTTVPTFYVPEVPPGETRKFVLRHAPEVEGNAYLIVGFTDSEQVSWKLDTAAGEVVEVPNTYNAEAIREAQRQAREAE